LEAAIGIEPMNKGFAEMDYVFAQVAICSLVPILIGVRRFVFAHDQPNSDLL